jgi:predicted DsbA family dithiol-disulfide isomerase
VNMQTGSMIKIAALATLVTIFGLSSAFAAQAGEALDQNELQAREAWRATIHQSEKPVDSPAAIVDGRNISLAALEAKAQGRLVPIQAQEYDVRRQVLDEAVDQILLEEEAARRGISVEKLIQVEIEVKIKPVTPDQVLAVYETYRERYGAMAEDDALKQIESRLRQARIKQRRSEFLDSLRFKSQIAIYLEPPRQAVNAEDARSKGPVNAPVTLVEFGDFQCPWCSRSVATLRQVEQRYSGKVRLVFRDFVTPGFHFGAPKAAEAASCANEQGKFWAMYDKLFDHQSDLSVPALKQYAAGLGLNSETFNQCLDSDRYAAKWRHDTEEAKGYGIDSTPTFFVNGRMLAGAQTLDVFSQVIDEELKRTGQLASASATPTR